MLFDQQIFYASSFFGNHAIKTVTEPRETIQTHKSKPVNNSSFSAAAGAQKLGQLFWSSIWLMKWAEMWLWDFFTLFVTSDKYEMLPNYFSYEFRHKNDRKVNRVLLNFFRNRVSVLSDFSISFDVSWAEF